MTNWIVVLTKDNLHLTEKAVGSFRLQDVEGGVKVLAVDNHSKDNTAEWLGMQRDIYTIFNRPANSVAGAWNQALRWLFGARWGNVTKPLAPRAEWVLVVNNDVVLRPDTYRRLVEDGGGFVTAVGTRDPEKIKVYSTPNPNAKRPHPDFSCYLIRRSVWEKVGEFDEGFKGAFYEDNCYHLRMHKAGISAYCLDLPFLHYGSATIKSATPSEVKQIQGYASANKERFFQKYGVYAGSPEYYALFGHSAPEDQSEQVGDRSDTARIGL